MKNTLWSNLALPLVILLFSGIYWLSCLYPYRAEDTQTRTRSAQDINTISVTSHNGAITANAVNDTTVAVKITRYAYGRTDADARARLERVTITDTVISNTWSLTVQTPPAIQPLGARFNINAPSGIHLDLTTSNDKVTINGFRADFNVTASNAVVSCIGTSGNAVITTNNGKVIVQVHSGTISAQTSNAAIECDIAHLPATGSVNLKTSNDDVTLLLPPDVSATVNATTSSGTAVIAGYSGVVYYEQTQNHIRARIGSGAANITINTSNGDIVIKSRY